MSCSISVFTTTKERRDLFQAFLDKHYCGWCDDTTITPTSNDFSDVELGFHYPTGLWGWHREYIFCIIRFLALRMGVTKEFEGIVGPKPFYVYDGFEEFPLTVSSMKPIERSPLIYVDRYGWPTTLTPSQGIEIELFMEAIEPGSFKVAITPNRVQEALEIIGSYLVARAEERFSKIKSELIRLDELSKLEFGV